MALYDVWINGVALSNPSAGYAVDGFRGRRAVAPPRTHEEYGLGPGIKSMNLAPDTFPVVLEMWFDGRDSPAVLEQNMDIVMRALQYRRGQNPLVEWQAVDGSRRSARCVLHDAIPDIEHATRYARLKITLENVEGAWRGPVVTEKRALGQSVPTNPSMTAAVLDATFKVVGPATNPIFRSGDGLVQFNGTVPAGQTLTITSYPQSCDLNGTQLARQLVYSGSDGRFLDIYPGETVTCTASGTTTASSWSVTYRPSYS